MVFPQAPSVEGLATGDSHFQVVGGRATAESAIAKNTTAASTAAECTAIDENVVLMDIDQGLVSYHVTSHFD